LVTADHEFLTSAAVFEHDRTDDRTVASHAEDVVHDVLEAVMTNRRSRGARPIDQPGITG
jgi:hypothetical protein